MQPRTEERISSRPGRRLTDFLPPATTTTQETEPEETEPEEIEPEEPQYNQHGSLSTSHDPEPSATYNRRTTSGPDGPATRTITKRYEVPVSRLGSRALMPVVTPDRAIVKIEKVEDDDLIPAGEEFTPEGAKEVAEAAEEEGAVIPRRPVRRRNTSTPAAASALWAVFAALLIAYFVWWRKEKIEIGYCGVGNTGNICFSLTAVDRL